MGLFKYQLSKQQQAKMNLQANQEDDMDVIKRLRKWEKFQEFPSVLPDLLMWKFDSEAQGCFKIQFCNSGKYLAAACTMDSNKNVIKIFDVEDGNL